jgi:hypothetical protein
MLNGFGELNFQNVKRYLGKTLGHIVKANDVKYHESPMKPDLMILKAYDGQIISHLF